MTLLTYSDFEKFLKSMTVVKARMISNILINYIFINKDSEMYSINDNLTLTRVLKPEQDNYVLTKILELVNTSFYKLSEQERQLIFLTYPKEYANMNTNGGMKKILPQVYCYIRTDINIAGDPNHIHFVNGYLDIKDKKFKKRQKPNYVLECIDRKYKKAKTKNINYVMNILKQIYPNDVNREQIFRVIGCAFSGQIIDERFSLFLLGKSQAGKSVLMKMLYSAFTKSYVMEFQSDFFDKGSKTVNKTINQFMKSPNVRISWVNELKNSAVDTSFFKKFCEGAMQTTSLYKDGINDVRHNSVAVITANELPNMHQDTGVKSRIKALKHSSYFTEIKEDVDESKHIYHRDNQLIRKISEDKGVLDAIVHIVIDYANKYLNSEYNLSEWPEDFDKAKDEIVMTNDTFQDFIDGHLVITGNDKDRISKNDMLNLFRDVYPKKHMSPTVLLSALKDKDLLYSSQYRHKSGIRGVYYGVRLKEAKDEENIVSHGVSVAEHKKALDEIEQLKQQIEELKKQLQEKPIVKDKPKKQLQEKPKKQKRVVKKNKSISDAEYAILEAFNLC